MINLVFHALDSISNVIVPFLMKQVWFSSVVFIIILLLVKVFKRLSPYWQLGLWTLVLLRLLLPPSFSHSYSIRNMMSHLPYYQPFSTYIASWFLNNSVGSELNNSLHVFSFDNQLIDSIEPGEAFNLHNKKIISWQTIVFLTWFSGVIIFLLIYLKRIWKFQKIMNKSQPVNNAIMELLLSKWKRQFQIKRKVQLVSSEKFLSPFTQGLFRPKIYVPQYFLEKNHTGNLEAIIAHEMAHIKRRDNFWLKIQYLIQILYFFHPAIWYVNSNINLARECLCDRLVLSHREISSLSYGKSMMTVLRLNLFGVEGFFMLPGFGSHKNALKYRIKNINGGTTMKHTQFIILYASLFILGCWILPMAGHVIKPGDRSVLAGDTYAQQLAAISSQQDKIVVIAPTKQGKVTAPFGKWIDPFTKKEAFHNGIDIAAPKGTEIYAAADGNVIVAESAPQTHGNYIVLQHEQDFQTFYSHCDTLLVEKGQPVKAGELIARIGNTGRSTGPHLHFEIRKDGKSQDPQDHLDFSSLKLLK